LVVGFTPEKLPPVPEVRRLLCVIGALLHQAQVL
jgi:hypothetical protein